MNGMDQQRHRIGRKVPVLYYLCRNRQLEHPHFIEVTLVSPDGLYLRDVIEKFDSLRGRGMASMYSWSCKRSYKNAFVWNDLGEDDLIVPAHENEYVLKGSELVEENISGRFALTRNMTTQNLEQLTEPPSSIPQEDYLSSTNIIGRGTKMPETDENCHSLTNYKIYKSTHGLADASTQTDEHLSLQVSCTTSLLTDKGPADSLTNDSPPSSSGACSSACKTDTLESLMKADAHNFHTSEKLEQQEEKQQQDDEYQVQTNTKIRALLQLISCGSVPSQDHYFSQPLSCRSSSFDPKLEDKQYFSGSLVETNLVKNDETSNLKRSFSFTANRMNTFDSTLTRTKCIPRSIMGSLSKNSRSTSMRLCEDSNSCICSPCLSNNGSNRITGACLTKKPSKRMESFRDNKENVIKIEERLSSGARVIIHLDANDHPAST